MAEDPYAADRARDDLAFEPLPPSEFIRVSDDGIRIAVGYSEALSHLLSALPGAEWLPLERIWRLPFTSHKSVRAVIPTIDRLAPLATEAPEEEDRQRRLAALAAEARMQERALKTAQDRIRHGGRPRPLRREFLVPRDGARRISFELECIDDRSPLSIYCGKEQKPWVAQVFGSDGRGGFNRSFLGGAKDYSRANSKGSRGVYRCYVLEEGPVYEVNDRVSWTKTQRYFLRFQDGETVRMTADEVWSCIES